MACDSIRRHLAEKFRLSSGVSTVPRVDPDGATGTPVPPGRFPDLEQLQPLALLTFGVDIHSMLSLVGDGVVSTDQKGRIVLFNRAAEEIFGYELSEVLGQPIDLLIPQRFHESHCRDFADFSGSPVPVRRAMGSGREVSGQHKHHGELAIEATLSRQMIGGNPIVTVVVRDIRERKKTEIQRQMVANEVAHRLHNTMTIVNSIVSLTFRSAASLADFKDTLLGRFAAVSRTNRYLTDGLTVAAEVDLRWLLVSELAAFDEDEKITLSGPDVSLGSEIAIAVALVIHELATNATKYGSLSIAAGSLRVEWQVLVEGGPTLQLVWQEENGPAVAVPSRVGFGTALISQGLASHRGRVELDFAASGVTCRITLPLA